MGVTRGLSIAPVSLRRRALQVFFLASIVSVQTSISDAATIRARYSLSYLGARLGELTVVNNVGPVNYGASLNAQLGITAVASNRIDMKASGTLRGGLILPSSFSLSQAGSERRTIRVVLAAGTARTVEIDPPFERLGPAVPLTEEHKRNVVDPLSALIMPLPAIGAELSSSCNRTLRLFTGAGRADLEFAYAGPEDLRSKAYKGPAARCSIRYRPLAGHNPNSTMTTFMQANQGIKARLALLPDIPFAMLISATVPLPLGKAAIELVEYSIEPTVTASERANIP